MTPKEFAEVRSVIERHCSNLLNVVKANEYTMPSEHSDRLEQFKLGGQMMSNSVTSLFGMWHKHLTKLILTMRKHENGARFTESYWLELLGDNRNYIDLLWALLHDEHVIQIPPVNGFNDNVSQHVLRGAPGEIVKVQTEPVEWNPSRLPR